MRTFLQDREAVRDSKFGSVWNDEIPEVFADVPAYYDEVNQAASLGLYGWWVGKFVSAASAHIPAGARVLDVCSGMHDIPFRLFHGDPTIEMYAVDRSYPMIREGGRRARERGFRVNSKVCDVHSLPYPNDTFDAVTMQFASRHVRIGTVFSEINRVLKPGGIFCHNDMLKPASKPVEKAYFPLLRLSMITAAMCFRSSPASRHCIRYLVDTIKNFYTPHEMSQALQVLGFEVLETENFLSGIFAYHIARKR